MANRNAIVIGGSMAGLCAARVLSEFYDRVTVIDTTPTLRVRMNGPGFRKAATCMRC